MPRLSPPTHLPANPSLPYNIHHLGYSKTKNKTHPSTHQIGSQPTTTANLPITTIILLYLQNSYTSSITLWIQPRATTAVFLLCLLPNLNSVRLLHLLILLNLFMWTINHVLIYTASFFIIFLAIQGLHWTRICANCAAFAHITITTVSCGA